MSGLVSDAMMAETVAAAGYSMDTATTGPDALASPSYKALESRSVFADTAFIKRIHPEMRDGFDIESAIRAATLAGDAGIGPKVFWSDPATGAIAMEALGTGWRTARQNDLQDSKLVGKIMNALKALHTAPALSHRFEPFVQIDSLIAAHEAEGVALPQDIVWMRRLIGTAEGLVDTTHLTPCRNDGSSSNVLIGPGGEVRLVDFDRAGMNDPLYDVGCLLAEMTDHERDMYDGFVAYAGGFDEVAFCRARLWSHVDDMIHALWSRLMAHRSERKGIEWIKYGEWRLLRLRMSLLHPLFEEKVRITKEAAL
jgi:thiamine kinase-like enzyme